MARTGKCFKIFDLCYGVMIGQGYFTRHDTCEKPLVIHTCSPSSVSASNDNHNHRHKTGREEKKKKKKRLFAYLVYTAQHSKPHREKVKTLQC